MKKNIKNLAVFVCVCTVITLLLAITNHITAPIILKNQNASANKALLQVMPDGSRILRAAPVPEPVMAERPVGVTEKPRKEKAAKPKKERQCVVCGKVLGRYQRKYCSDGCEDKVKKERYKAAPRGPYVSTAVREDRPCAVCGKMMLQVTQGKKYCCPDCRAEGLRQGQRRYREANFQARYCQICGERIEGQGIKYCASCAEYDRKRRRREYDRNKRRKKASAESAGDAE